MQHSHFPFQEVPLGENVFIRLFVKDLPSDELIWHWDKEDRTIEVLQSGGWSYQERDKKSRKLKNRETFSIHTGVWHRILKGSGDLIIKVTKHVPQKKKKIRVRH